MKLNLKSDRLLIEELKGFVQTEREALMQVIRYLGEVEERQLDLQMGYSNLYQFCRKELCYSKGSAYRRIATMNLLKDVPEAGGKIEGGAMLLDNASAAHSAFRRENKWRKKQGMAPMTPAEKKKIVAELEGKTCDEGVSLLCDRLPQSAPVGKSSKKRLRNGRTEITFVASEGLMGKLDELQNLLAHSNYEGSMEVLIEKLADIALAKLKPKAPKAMKSPTEQVVITPAQGPQTKETQRNPEKPSAEKIAPASGRRSRYIPAQEKRKLWPKRAAGCAYQDPKTGKTCGSQHGLQMDHLQPFSQNGSNTAENLQYLCGPHNRWRAERLTGST